MTITIDPQVVAFTIVLVPAEIHWLQTLVRPSFVTVL
jgi:hypothetical protein